MAVGLHVRGVGYTCKHSKICALEALLTVTMRFYQCSTGGAGVGTLGWLIHRLPRLLPRDAACGGSWRLPIVRSGSHRALRSRRIARVLDEARVLLHTVL